MDTILEKLLNEIKSVFKSNQWISIKYQPNLCARTLFKDLRNYICIRSGVRVFWDSARENKLGCDVVPLSGRIGIIKRLLSNLEMYLLRGDNATEHVGYTLANPT